MAQSHSKGAGLLVMVFLALSGAGLLAMHPQGASAATNIEAAYTTASIPINGVVTPGEWTATPVLVSEAGMTVTFEQNSTGLLFLMQWQSSGYCTDEYCFGGVEMGSTDTTGNMGSPSTPTTMVLVSKSFAPGYDEFISTGEETPTSVETAGYSTQSTCAETISGGAYTAECYRPFRLSNATPYDPFLALVKGSPIVVGFAVGEFNQPGFHEAIGMGTYTLTLSQPPPSSATSTPSPTSETTTLPFSVTSPASTSTSSSATTAVSTATTSAVTVTVSTLIQTAQAVPWWAYAMMLVLLIIGGLVGFYLGHIGRRSPRRQG